jgi:glyoxylase-like metal-dependent hydrolase (beta-lactamase superfamily II)
MIIRQLFDPETSTYTYLLADEISHTALLIDPVIEQLERDLRLLRELGCTLLYSLDTHVHADHITASGSLRKQTGCQTAVSHHAGVGCADIALKEGDIIKLGDCEIRVLETPGHTPTCLSFIIDKHVFTGDSLLIRGCGRTDFQQGDAGKLYDSITQKLFTLADDVLVRPGHDYHGMLVSTIGEEKQYNPRLKLDKAAFIQFMGKLNLPDPNKIHEAIPANMGCGEQQAS